MNIPFLLSLIASAIYLTVGIFVYAKKKHNPINKSFALMLLCVSLWHTEVAGIINAPNPQFAALWGKVFRNGLLFIPPALLHFSLVFTHPHGFSRRSRKILWASYIVSVFLAVINWTPYFTAGVKEYPWGYHIQSGPLYSFFIAQFILCTILSFFYLIRGFLHAESYQRQKLRFFFLAVVVSFILSSVNFLSMFGVEIYPVGSIIGCAGLFIGAYSVVQHRLMDVSVFMAKGLGYILSLTLLAVPGGLVLILLQNYFFHNFDVTFSVIAVSLGAVLAVVFNKVKSQIDQAMQQIILRDKYTYHQVLKEFSRNLVTIVGLKRLLRTLAETVERNMGVERISIFLHDREKNLFRLALAWGAAVKEEEEISFKMEDPFIQYLHGEKESVLRAELERIHGGAAKGELLKTMERMKIEVCLPLIYMNQLIGFINLGNKSADEIYYVEDLDLLNSLANQVAIAIENANLYENLKKSQGIMRRADRLASLGTLVASLAHEIRNPLVSIKTFTQLLPERLDDEEFRNYFLKVASGEIDRLTNLINELLGFARPSEPNLQEEDINSLIEKMGVLISSEARKKNIALIKQFAPDLPLVMVDAEQIKQVLLNVFLNAIQAIPGEGKIWIETRVVQLPGEETTRLYLQIEVRDTGVGIPKDHFEHIFDPFFSTRPDGSGLGMSISHQIIHEHGGFIDLESEVGKGTSFRIHLPLDAPGKGAGQEKGRNEESREDLLSSLTTGRII